MIGPNTSNAQASAESTSTRKSMAEIDSLLREETLSIVGKSHKGTAFVPFQYTILDKSDDIINTYKNELGEIENNINNQGYLGGLTWLENSDKQVSFCKILGFGNDSGFIVGDNIISGSSTPGIKGPNPFAKEGGIKGKTYFFGRILSASQTSNDTISGYNDYFEQLGYDANSTLPIVTHVIMMPSGTAPSLKTDDSVRFNTVGDIDPLKINRSLRNKKASNTFGKNDSDNFGSLVSKDNSFFSDIPEDIMYINGLSGSNQNYLNEIKLEPFDINKIKWSEREKLNTESTYQIDRGNYLYTKFPCRKSIFKEVVDLSKLNYDSFILSGSFSPSSTQPNYEDFNTEFKKAQTPWIVSQILNRDKVSDIDVSQISSEYYEKLFKIHTYDDGEVGNRFRIRISPIRLGEKLLNINKDLYSYFNIELYEYIKTRFDTYRFVTLTKFENLNLDINSKDFIGRVIGTEYFYYDEDSNKIISKGDFKKTNPWIYVELNNKILENTLDPKVIPAGFEEYPHINLNKNYVYDSNHTGFPDNFQDSSLDNICQTPIEFVHSLYKIPGGFNIDERHLYWGISFNKVNLVKESLRRKIIGNTFFGLTSEKYFMQPRINFYSGIGINQIESYSKYFNNSSQNNASTWVTGSFQNGLFHLEKILISKTGDKIDWNYAMYRRDGKNIGNIDSLNTDGFNFQEVYKYLNLEKELNDTNKKYLSFDLFTYGGFDGLNIFDKDLYLMNNNACVREENNSANGSVTIDAYKRGTNLVKDYSNCTTDILSVPGISVKSVLDNFRKLNDNDPNFIMIKELGFTGNNLDTITGSLLIEQKNIPEDIKINSSYKNLITSSSNPSEYFEFINNYNNNELIVYNGFHADVLTQNIEAGPSLPTIKAMALNEFSPLDEISLSANDELSTVKFIEIIDRKYSKENSTTNFDDNKENLIKKGINPYVFENGENKLGSSNSTYDVRKSSLRQIFNSRILNSIKKDIKFNLFIDSNVLFNQNSKISNINVQAKLAIDQILNSYQSQGIIKNYYTKIEDNHNIKKNIKDLENYILRGRIFIEFFTNTGNGESMVQIMLNDTLSDLSLNADANSDVSIITV